MLTLAIDASTYVGDVALFDDDRLLAELSVPMRDPEHERLMPAVAEVLRSGGSSVDRLDRVVCGAGPGSFTSLRIAGGIAKGIAAGRGIPLFAVSSLGLIVGSAAVGMGTYLPAIDALRGEYYAGLYHRSAGGAVVELERPRLVAADSLASVAGEHGAVVISPSVLDGGVVASPRAAAARALAETMAAHGPVDLDAWEPSYGRLAEAQVKWEAANGRPLPTG